MFTTLGRELDPESIHEDRILLALDEKLPDGPLKEFILAVYQDHRFANAVERVSDEEVVESLVALYERFTEILDADDETRPYELKSIGATPRRLPLGVFRGETLLAMFRRHDDAHAFRRLRPLVRGESYE